MHSIKYLKSKSLSRLLLGNWKKKMCSFHTLLHKHYCIRMIHRHAKRIGERIVIGLPIQWKILLVINLCFSLSLPHFFQKENGFSICLLHKNHFHLYLLFACTTIKQKKKKKKEEKCLFRGSPRRCKKTHRKTCSIYNFSKYLKS